MAVLTMNCLGSLSSHDSNPVNGHPAPVSESGQAALSGLSLVLFLSWTEFFMSVFSISHAIVVRGHYIFLFVCLSHKM